MPNEEIWLKLAHANVSAQAEVENAKTIATTDLFMFHLHLAVVRINNIPSTYARRAFILKYLWDLVSAASEARSGSDLRSGVGSPKHVIGVPNRI